MAVSPFPGYGVYNDDYYKGKGPDPFVDYESEWQDYKKTDRVIEFDDIYRIVQNYLAQNVGYGPVRWLDYGCGAGGFLKYLRDRKSICGRPIEVIGCDIGSYAERLRNEGIPMWDIQELGKTDRLYEVITCIEVVEHIKEVDDVFSTFARTLQTRGLLILTTGNLDSKAARMAGISYSYMIPEIHISLFNPQILERLYRKNGLTPYRTQYSGVVRFKVIKSVRNPIIKMIARLVLRLPYLTYAIDRFYGVSDMPCAVRE